MKPTFIIFLLFAFLNANSGIPTSVLQLQDLSSIFYGYSDELQDAIQEFSLKTGIPCHVVSSYALTKMSTEDIKEIMDEHGNPGLLIVFNKDHFSFENTYTIDIYIDPSYQDIITKNEIDLVKNEVIIPILEGDVSVGEKYGDNVKYFMATNEGLKKLTEIGINGKINGVITSAEWVDKNMKNTNVLTYGESKLYIKFRLNESCKGRTFKLRLEEFDPISNELILEKTFYIDTDEKEFSISLDYTNELFTKGGINENEQELTIKIYENKNLIFFDQENLFYIHSVIFIPGIMKSLGCVNGEKLQNL